MEGHGRDEGVAAHTTCTGKVSWCTGKDFEARATTIELCEAELESRDEVGAAIDVDIGCVSVEHTPNAVEGVKMHTPELSLDEHVVVGSVVCNLSGDRSSSTVLSGNCNRVDVWRRRRGGQLRGELQ